MLVLTTNGRANSLINRGGVETTAGGTSMKRRLLVPGILFVMMSTASVPSTVFGQAFFAGGKGGLSIPSLRGGNSEISEGYSTRMGPDFGAYLGDEISNAFAVQIELLYSSQGREEKRDAADTRRHPSPGHGPAGPEPVRELQQ